jgi:hypothetical protein
VAFSIDGRVESGGIEPVAIPDVPSGDLVWQMHTRIDSGRREGIMKCARWLCLLIVIGMATVAFADDIQIFCESGLRVYLDGELAGISSRLDDELYLMDVGRGTHAVRVKKDGFIPQTFEVVVGQETLETSVGKFTQLAPEPAEAARAAGPAEVPLGSLLVTSAPQN